MRYSHDGQQNQCTLNSVKSRITKAQQKLLWTRIKFGFTSDFRSLCGDLSWIDLNSVSPLSLWMSSNEIIPVPLDATCPWTFASVTRAKDNYVESFRLFYEKGIKMSNSVLLKYKFWWIDIDCLRQYVKKNSLILYTAKKKCNYQLGSIHEVYLPTLSYILKLKISWRPLLDGQYHSHG